ncbi:GDSL-type esterase/lipase family protein [Nocardia sp. NPDC088792]|uniref:DUF459 domain-containing protein n=1 Tax=Nocardia sp. NPDC088792 TaxID=3364332 RepID=UPI0037F6DDBB
MLVVIRGNSGSGKTTTARAVQQRFPRATCLVVSQDTVRRLMLREFDGPAATNIDLLEHIAMFGLSRGMVVIVEGILDADRYGPMLQRLTASATHALHYCFDLSFEQTLIRHAGRPQAADFSGEQMAQWYRGWQPLPFTDEVRIDAAWELDSTVDRIHTDIIRAHHSGSPTPAAPRVDSATGLDADRLEGAVSSRPAMVSSCRRALRFAWFGTSLTEHYEAHHPRLVDQTDLPPVGSLITVAQWRHRGYVHAVTVWASTRFPHIEFTAQNYGAGGATSNDVLATVRAATHDHPSTDLAVFGCGINDVWRFHQGRHHEAVDIDCYERNIDTALRLLGTHARQILVIGEPPIGWDPAIDVPAANTMLAAYNHRAREVAARNGAGFVDLWTPFHDTARCWGWDPSAPSPVPPSARSLWSDGIHLSELGVELVRDTITRYLLEHRTVEALLAEEGT